jgi:di/tricarboxylate transporter
MTLDQGVVFALLAAALAGFVLQPVRYDVVALVLLLALVVLGYVGAQQAFLGFAEPAVVTVAAVLAISRGLQGAGTVDMLIRAIAPLKGKPRLQVAAQTAICTAISAFMNNVGALALLLPVALRNAYREGYAPSRSLMPLAFGSLLGGLITLIGTPPNLIVSGLRAEYTGQGQFALFDFAWVGLPVALAGLAYLVLVEGRMLRDARGAATGIDPGDYVAEARIPEGSRADGLTVWQVEALGQGEVTVVGLFRGERRKLAPAGAERLRVGDALLLEGAPEDINVLVGVADLTLGTGDRRGARVMASEEVEVVEAIIRPASPLIGRSPAALQLRSAHGVNLLAVSRQGRRVAERMGSLTLRTGDVLLLQARADRIAEAFQALGLLPLVDRSVGLGRPQRAALAAALFGVGILLVLFDLAPAHIAFPGVVVAMLLLRVLRPDEAYQAVDWPVIVLLGALFPLGAAMETTGATRLLVDALGGPAGALPGWGMVAVLILACMLLSEIMANNATVLLMTPLALGLAPVAGLAPDAALMAVAIGTSCTFLSPIGHQSNTLVMEPGGYRFADYARLGAPLAVICLAVGTVAIMLVWA